MIKINNLSKKIRRRRVLNNINAELKGITGILGPNGAGKTTLMKIIASVEKGDGDTEIIYKKKNDNEVKIGFLPQNFYIYPNLTVMNVLKLLSTLQEMYDEDHLERLLNQLALTEYRNEKMKNLSGGTLQRVGIAQALLNKPDYLIIDEPTTGLDINECIKLRTTLLSISREVDIIISSHIPEDITSICNHLIVIEQGGKIFEGGLKEIIEKSNGLTYETVVHQSEISELNRIGSILKVGQLSDNKLKVRIVTKTPLLDGPFKEVKPDFLSGYVSLLKGEK
ncbi:ATP-binding cassette domain-containing protein [Priestia megaterium]|jgi:ABC-2 type transport system ATP-binding protein|uniref:ATP-binding cassette domain-containing protein n=1 Tax=Priestia megaterium TaxID=1404 RepID=UPI00227FF973|nr:ATP-binding cassette domain-containing protein [Priestia megaterium]MCY9026600.1 ATP-binding cassette domain-containing protein [Priestia megaterium]MDF2013870.1 ATP-binding cassette domain-containing protein [Priestia megaterium]